MLAILIKQIEIEHFGHTLVFFKEESITIDVANLVAYAKGLHFEIKSDEYVLCH